MTGVRFALSMNGIVLKELRTVESWDQLVARVGGFEEANLIPERESS